MDARFTHSGKWLGVVAVVAIGLLLMACIGTTFLTLLVRTTLGPVPLAPMPEGAEGAVVPLARHGLGFHPFGLVIGVGLILGLLFLGLVVFLIVWRSRRMANCGPTQWGLPFWGQSPQSEEGEGQPGAHWGPWAYHRHWKGHPRPPWWGPAPEPTGEAGEAKTAEE